VIRASDPNGYQNITAVQILYNWYAGGGADGCLLNYDVANDALHIGDLTGSVSTFGSMSLLSPSDTLGDLVNSNCQIIGAGSSLTHSGNNLTLNLNTVFRPGTGGGDPLANPPGLPGFIGSQNIYMMTTSSDQQQQGPYQLVGTWTPYPVPYPGTYSNIAPINSVNSDGTVSVQFNNENGVNYAPYAQLVFGTSQTDPAACRIQYKRGTGTVNHTLALHAGDFTQASEIGEGPVPDPGGVVQDNSTCILDIGHSYVVFDSGTTAIVNMALTFKNTGTINTYVQAFDRQNVAGALQTSSIYIPPNNFSLTSVSAFSVQQSGTPASFVVSAPASGNFSGNVSLSYTAPAGVTLTFNSTSLSTPGSANSTAVQVNASASAVPGTGNIAITGTSGTLTYTLNIPVTVTPATPPSTPASGFSLSPVAPVVVQQSGAAASFALNVATTGSFSGPVTFTYSAPSGVSLAFQANPLTVPASSSTNVQVTASSAAAVAAGNITITATNGSQSATVSTAVTVTGGIITPPAGATPTFILSGGQQQTLNVSSYTSSATFYVTVTGLYGYSSPVTVSISPSTPSAISATINGSNSATVSPGQAVPVLLQGLGAITAAASAAANNLNYWCTDVIGSDSNGLQVQSGALCLNFNGATSSSSFSIPASANGITIPAGGSTTIYGSLSTYGGAPTPSFTQSVTCPAGVSPCNASAAFGTLSGGLVPITVNAGSLPSGTTYKQTILVNGVAQEIPVTVLGQPSPTVETSLTGLQNCINAANGVDPVVCQLAANTTANPYYSVSSTININQSNITVTGISNTSTLLVRAPTFTGPMIQVGGNSPVDNIVIQQLGICGGATLDAVDRNPSGYNPCPAPVQTTCGTWTDEITAYALDETTIPPPNGAQPCIDVAVSNADTSAIAGDFTMHPDPFGNQGPAPFSAQILNNIFQGATGYALQIYPNADLTPGQRVNDVNISGNKFYSSEYSGLLVGVNYSNGYSSGYGFFDDESNCDASNVQPPFNSSSVPVPRNIQITSNIFSNIDTGAVAINHGRYVAISGNAFSNNYNNPQGGNSVGGTVFINHCSDTVLITGNALTGEFDRPAWPTSII
jgi:hypothetical protein